MWGGAIKEPYRKLIKKPKLASLPRLAVLPLKVVKTNKKEDDIRRMERAHHPGPGCFFEA